MKPVLLAVLGMSTLVSACDPAPRVRVRNSTSGPLTLTYGSGGSEILAPQKRAIASRTMIVKRDCNYAFKVPDDFWRMGSVRLMEIREDMKLYLYRSGVILDAKNVEKQPPGWPLSPTSKTCP